MTPLPALRQRSLENGEASSCLARTVVSPFQWDLGETHWNPPVNCNHIDFGDGLGEAASQKRVASPPLWFCTCPMAPEIPVPPPVPAPIRSAPCANPLSCGMDKWPRGGGLVQLRHETSGEGGVVYAGVGDATVVQICFGSSSFFFFLAKKQGPESPCFPFWAFLW